MSTNLKYFDILGINPILYSNSFKRKKTLFGGLMSIFSVILCITGVIYFFLEVFLRSSYSVIYNQSTDMNPVLNFTQIPYAFTVVDGDGRLIKDFENQIRIYAEYMYMYPDNISNEIVVIKREFIKLNKCNIDDFGEYKYLFINFPKINQFFCLPMNKFNFTIYGTFADSRNPNSVINIRISKCFNDPNKTDLFPIVDCFNRTFIDKNLVKIFFSSLNPEYDIDHSDPHNPGKIILRSETLQLTSTIYNRYYMFKRIINYISDYGFLMSSSVKKKYFQEDTITHMTDLRVDSDPNGLFGLITLTLSKKTDFYSRNYLKLQNAFANIGGIVEGILFVFSLFVKFIMKDNFFYDLAYSSYEIEKGNIKDIKYSKLLNESIMINAERNGTYKKYSEFKSLNQTNNEVVYNFKKSEQINPDQNFIKNYKNYENNNESSKPEFKNDQNILPHNQNASINKDVLNENKKIGNFKTWIPKREYIKSINQKLEIRIRKDLSVENLLKLMNFVETIEKDLLYKKIIENNSGSFVGEKIQGLYINHIKESKIDKMDNNGK